MMTMIRTTVGCALCLGILIPIVTGFIALRMARKKENIGAPLP